MHPWLIRCADGWQWSELIGCLHYHNCVPLANLKADGFVITKAPITSGLMDFGRELLDVTTAVGRDGTLGPFDGIEMVGYEVFGCAVAEVELDTLTGESNLLQVDLCYDAAKSLNPVIDLGQIQGAFMVSLAERQPSLLVASGACLD